MKKFSCANMKECKLLDPGRNIIGSGVHGYRMQGVWCDEKNLHAPEMVYVSFDGETKFSVVCRIVAC